MANTVNRALPLDNIVDRTASEPVCVQRVIGSFPSPFSQQRRQNRKLALMVRELGSRGKSKEEWSSRRKATRPFRWHSSREPWRGPLDNSLYGFANFIEGRGGGIEPKVLQERRPLKVSFRQGYLESE